MKLHALLVLLSGLVRCLVDSFAEVAAHVEDLIRQACDVVERSAHWGHEYTKLTSMLGISPFCHQEWPSRPTLEYSYSLFGQGQHAVCRVVWWETLSGVA